MKILAYLRVSTNSQNLDNQKLAILDFAQREGITITDFIQVETSSRSSFKKRQLDKVFEQLEKGEWKITELQLAVFYQDAVK